MRRKMANDQSRGAMGWAAAGAPLVTAMTLMSLWQPAPPGALDAWVLLAWGVLATTSVSTKRAWLTGLVGAAGLAWGLWSGGGIAFLGVGLVTLAVAGLMWEHTIRRHPVRQEHDVRTTVLAGVPLAASLPLLAFWLSGSSSVTAVWVLLGCAALGSLSVLTARPWFMAVVGLGVFALGTWDFGNLALEGMGFVIIVVAALSWEYARQDRSQRGTNQPATE